jgi:hypothetical protein
MKSTTAATELYDLLLLPNVIVEWLTLPFHIREVPGSNLLPGTGCLEGFLVFLSLSRWLPR